MSEGFVKLAGGVGKAVETVPDIYGTNADRDSVDRTLCEPSAVKSGKQRKCVNYLDKAPQIG